MYCKARRTLNAKGVTLTAHNDRIGSIMRDGSPTLERLRGLIRRHKPELLEELKTHRVVHISGENFYGPGLMADAEAHAKRPENE